MSPSSVKTKWPTVEKTGPVPGTTTWKKIPFITNSTKPFESKTVLDENATFVVLRVTPLAVYVSRNGPDGVSSSLTTFPSASRNSFTANDPSSWMETGNG